MSKNRLSKLEKLRPTPKNVDLGNLLLSYSEDFQNFCLHPITKITRIKLISESTAPEIRSYIEKIFDDCVVLKKDGTYLFGANIKQRFIYKS